MADNIPVLFDEQLCKRLIMFLPEKLQERVRSGLKLAEELFANDRHFDVQSTINSILNMCTEVLVSVVSPEPVIAKPTNSVDVLAAASPSSLSINLFMSFIRDSKLYRVSLEKVQNCSQLLDDIADKIHWKLVESSGINDDGTYYRYDEKTQAHLFKVIGEVPNSIIYVLGVLMEPDLYTEWFPFCFHATVQGELTRFHKASQLMIRVPWPFTNREIFLEGFGVDDLSLNKRVIIVSRSLCENRSLPPWVQLPKPNPYVRLEVEYGGFVVEALDPSRCRISFIINLDPKLPHAPMWLVNWASGKLVRGILREISRAAKQAESEKSKYAERRRQRPDIYTYLQERFCEVNKLHFSC
ncbi:uncharacterized protein TM35_000075000 [Trypanosoma theileri]|uniref:START domain-containing protein n=1 Tax=Trypanosoma theileri TaxID=67003 RepID=A0A1X0P2A5_9TRYP|nr:uncharacterized protein TM35_000075000 [Trypanosoma theileri]ORC91076.1 hypothetical protein TM35_000075000 [Trypanosoma theileri]